MQVYRVEREYGGLRRVGEFFLSVYEVPDNDVVFGGRQLVFNPARAQLVRRRAI